jgi:hypothetical protein
VSSIDPVCIRALETGNLKFTVLLLEDAHHWGDEIALMVEAASTSGMPVIFTRLHGATSQKTAICILVAVRT